MRKLNASLMFTSGTTQFLDWSTRISQTKVWSQGPAGRVPEGVPPDPPIPSVYPQACVRAWQWVSSAILVTVTPSTLPSLHVLY